MRVATVLACVAACGSSRTTPDAKAIDAARAVDARAVDAKVFLDAPVPSTILVVPDCTGIATGDIGLSVLADGAGFAFAPDAGTITHGQYVKFTSTGDHNMVNRSGAGPNVFRSGEAGTHTACLQFTAEGTFPWECEIHGSMMTGVLTVH